MNDADQELRAGGERPLLERGLDELVDPQDPFSPRVAQALAVGYMNLDKEVPEDVQEAVISLAMVGRESIQRQLTEWGRNVIVTMQQQPRVFGAVKDVMLREFVRSLARSSSEGLSGDEIRDRSVRLLKAAVIATEELGEEK